MRVACLVKTGLLAHIIMCDFLAMKLLLKEDVVSLTDFARKTREHTESLAKTHRPRVLTQNGKAAAVVMSTAAFEELVGDAEEHRLSLRLQDALEAYAEGDRGQPAAKVFRRLRTKLPAKGT